MRGEGRDVGLWRQLLRRVNGENTRRLATAFLKLF